MMNGTAWLLVERVKRIVEGGRQISAPSSDEVMQLKGLRPEHDCNVKEQLSMYAVFSIANVRSIYAVMRTQLQSL
jgi:hypothetical protein